MDTDIAGALDAQRGRITTLEFLIGLLLMEHPNPTKLFQKADKYIDTMEQRLLEAPERPDNEGVITQMEVARNALDNIRRQVTRGKLP